MTREQRTFYRFKTVARVSLRELEAAQVEGARLAVRTRARGISNPLAVADDTYTSAEQHAHLVLLQQILFSIDRLNYRVDELAERFVAGAGDARISLGPQQIWLSGSGFSSRSEIDLEPGALVEARIDMWEAGLPLIHCVGRVVSTQKVEKTWEIALNFEELLPEDRERIVQLSIRRQTLELRGARQESAS